MCSDDLFFRATDQAMEELLWLEADLTRLRLAHTFPCINITRQNGCPRCKEVTGNPFAMMDLKIEMAKS